MEYSLRWIEARKRFISLCEQHGPFTSKTSIGLNNLWNRWADLDDGSGDVVAKFVLELAQKLASKKYEIT